MSRMTVHAVTELISTNLLFEDVFPSLQPPANLAACFAFTGAFRKQERWKPDASMARVSNMSPSKVNIAYRPLTPGVHDQQAQKPIVFNFATPSFAELTSKP